ncbi:MAG: hypothetical protein PHQ90_08280 [Sulfuricurvum sp.]|uniref:hypothetical protein n=1 Tax=Sulfuricurvum sp. TaxID=2025608 RepID=UPI00262860B6|nr:hypothetical protein [Sulfuricurvum sp.]MDD2369284.1 hypothetical protein [Sulfuricurvum sp.]MDD5117900.1 hypothetical protein [Sulfuricurvum sp.]
MKSRIVLKAVTISLMISSVLTIVATVVLNKAGIYPFDVMRFHMGAGVLFLCVIPIHVYMMRQKLKKLSEQIVSLASMREVTSSCASQLLPHALHSKSLGEFCRFLGLDAMEVREKLQREQIMIIDMEEAIETIASKNRTDAMKIFSIMLQKDSIKAPSQKIYSGKLVFAA